MTSVQTDRIEGLTTSVAIKAPVRVATTANITLSGTQTIDGIAVVADDRVLVKNQTTTTQNGIYVCSSSTWSRASDCDGTRDLALGTLVYVRVGTVSGGKLFRQDTSGTGTATTIIFDTDSPAFSEADIFTAATTGFDFTYDTSTTTGADPGTGDFRINSATLASVTEVTFSANDADGNDISDYIATFDDGPASGVRGTIILRNKDDATDFAVYNVTSGVTDSTTHLTMTVAHVASGGTWSSASRFTMIFARAGALGVTISAFMETVLDDSTAAAARATLGAIILTDVTQAANTYTMGQSGIITTLTDASTVTINFSSVTNDMRWVLAGNRSVVAAGLPASGIRFDFLLEMVQSTGGNTASFSTDFRFASSSAPTLSTGANARDAIAGYAVASCVTMGGIVKNYGG